EQLDHFRHTPVSEHDDDNTFQQRYFVCREYWGPAGGGSANSPRGEEDGASASSSSSNSRRRKSNRGTAVEGEAGRGGERAAPGAPGPIFFYTGNEADVSLYLEASGLMWENAPAFNALLVFAEHRFYGESLPFGAPDKRREFLRQATARTPQALADYARLVTALKQELGAEGAPVVAFGGSYGGMLASWFRLKYPHIVHGAIAASAPVLALEGLHRPTPNPEAFAETVTAAAGPAGGAADSCAANVRRAFSAVLSPTGGSRNGSGGGGDDDGAVVDGGARKLRGSGSAEEGESASSHQQQKQQKQMHQQQQQPPRLSEGSSVASALPPPASPAASEVARRLRVCPGREPRGDGALVELAWWARAAFDYLAMGNFPYATGYILNSGEVELPPWPLREACSYLADPTLQAEDDDMLLGALADAIGVYYNATGEVGCFTPAAGANNASSVDADNWNWQACTEMSMPMSTDGKRDMFWRSDWDPVAQAAQCMEQFGVSPGEGWGAAEYGGYDSWSQ
ncbi:unnamed protein product, partial [Ectocarpus sp. 8 AP-2014]